MHGVCFDDAPWIEIAPGARHKAIERDGRRFRMVEFRREFVEPDWCRKGHLGVVLEGGFTVDFSGRVEHFRAGDGIAIPAGEAHRHQANVTDLVRLFLIEDL